MSQQKIRNLNGFVIELCETVTQYKLQTVDGNLRPKVISKSVEAFVDFAFNFFTANYSQNFADQFMRDVMTQGFPSVFSAYKYRSGIEYSMKIFKKQMHHFYCS